ncbi:MAG: hypothetical protein IPK71_28500 [Myxococcales bacterium]|nr:hypothetical protein [Myxococcales bacterium]
MRDGEMARGRACLGLSTLGGEGLDAESVALDGEDPRGEARRVNLEPGEGARDVPLRSSARAASTSSISSPRDERGGGAAGRVSFAGATVASAGTSFTDVERLGGAPAPFACVGAATFDGGGRGASTLGGSTGGAGVAASACAFARIWRTAPPATAKVARPPSSVAMGDSREPSSRERSTTSAEAEATTAIATSGFSARRRAPAKSPVNVAPRPTLAPTFVAATLVATTFVTAAPPARDAATSTRARRSPRGLSDRAAASKSRSSLS